MVYEQPPRLPAKHKNIKKLKAILKDMASASARLEKIRDSLDDLVEGELADVVEAFEELKGTFQSG
jgi:hypothetical protein